jgi:hypothetical protein
LPSKQEVTGSTPVTGFLLLHQQGHGYHCSISALESADVDLDDVLAAFVALSAYFLLLGPALLAGGHVHAGLADHAAQVGLAHAADSRFYEDLLHAAQQVARPRLVSLVETPHLLHQETHSPHKHQRQHHSLHLVASQILLDQRHHPLLAGRNEYGLVAAQLRSFLSKLAEDGAVGRVGYIEFLEVLTADVGIVEV